MSAQTTYNSQPAYGTPGMIAEPFSLRQIDSWLAGGTIPFGYPCALHATNKNWVVVATSPNDKYVGLSVFAQELNVQAVGTGDVSYKQYDQLPVMSKGRAWVKSALAVAAGDPAYALPNGSGQFTNVNPGGNTNIVVNGVFRTAATGAGQLVVVQFN